MNDLNIIGDSHVIIKVRLCMKYFRVFHLYYRILMNKESRIMTVNRIVIGLANDSCMIALTMLEGDLHCMRGNDFRVSF